jgi:hypothetical protein
MLLGEVLVYRPEVLLGYQRILDPRGIQTLEGGKLKKKKKIYEGGGGRFASQKIQWPLHEVMN